MDEKPIEESKPKITRSRARHERRKRLISARKAAEANSRPTNEAGIEANGSNDSKSPPVELESAEGLSKSKARRLRKRNKTRENGDNDTRVESPSCRGTESVRKASVEDTRAAVSKSKDDTDTALSRNDVIETNSSPKKAAVAKLSTSENELLENEKNLMITESSRIGTTLNCTIGVSGNDSRGLIINKDSSEIFEAKKPVEPFLESETSSNNRRGVDACDEESLIPTTKKSSNESPKVCGTSESLKSSEKMISQEKTREQVKAEREAKKAAKAAAKSKSKVGKPEVVEKTVETPSATKDPKKNVKESKIVAASEKVVATTTQPATTETTKKPEVVACSTDAKSEGKSKSEMRAERRAKQEAQRAAKQGQAAEKMKPKATSVKATTEPTKTTPTSPSKVDEATKKIAKRAILRENAHEVCLFKHLYHEREQALISVPTVNSTIHPAIVRLGVQYANKVIVGSNARCVALLAAVKQLIEDFERPSQADFTRGLEASLQESSAYLHHCRPLAVSMQNALRHLKWQMTQLPATTSDEDAKTKLGNAIDTYIQEQIQLADKAISITIQTKISNGDVILTYGYSSLICKILCDAYDAGRQFRVVVVDGRPWLEGREQLRRLAKHGLECSYVLINALSFIMPEVSKVFLGAHAILANGAVMSRVGTAQVALMAKAFNVPVLVACETHKTCERVQTDSIVYNEIADADELAQNLMGSSKRTTLMNWRAKKSLNLLNLTYDVTPADLVTAVVTELAILPCTSVPVILRIKPSEI